MIPATKKRIGDILLELGILSQAQLVEALDIQKETKDKLGLVLEKLGYISDMDIMKACEKQMNIASVDLDDIDFDSTAVAALTEEQAKKYSAIPFKLEHNILHVAMEDPLNYIFIDDMTIITGFKVKPYFAPRKKIATKINYIMGKMSTEEALANSNEEAAGRSKEFSDDDAADTTPIVKMINNIISQAAVENASDIHIEPFDDHVRVRLRKDGDLQEILRPSMSTHSSIVARMKVLANLDIAEKRVPQDGRLEIRLNNQTLDLRISTMPTVNGEKVVTRIVNRSTFLKTTEQLGLTEHDVEKYKKLLKTNTGIILVTGPTGSGKSTTLYAMLSELNDDKRNIITVEDPVEYKLYGVNQVQINHKTDMSFVRTLKAMLRQDPDVIMVGEIRDRETAEIAIRASITGHLVLSTLHTNDTVATISRLLDMDIESYLISSSVTGIFAQRLVKRICPDCRTAYMPEKHDLHLLNMEPGVVFYKGRGCRNCNNTGFKGRIPIHEILIIDGEIKEAISEKRNYTEIKSIAVKNGLITLDDRCKALIREGTTTVSEYFRVIYTVQ